jgi:hypothetical protein
MLARHAARAVLYAPLLVGPAAPSIAAQAPTGWNDARALELIDRARQARSSVATDRGIASYQADARGYVYFYIDRPDRDDHVLVKADQVALEVFWRAPNDTRQRIVGLRDEKVLPTSIRYHLDHLTVVQDDFGDRIRLGDGDEVGAVTHPVAPGSGEVYDFQLVDSLRLAYGTEGDEVRVYEVQVRPKRLDLPGFIGTVFLDLATGAIVRMNFSFTPASYVDPYLDYIRISLDNSLWLGRYWLPYRQEVELRREMPFLDFSAGSVIRSRFEIRAYDFDVALADELFVIRGVSAVSPAQRRAFPFEQGLFDEIDDEGLTISTTMEEVRTQVREVVEDETLSGLAPIRLHFDGLSDFARYNRAEGLYLGAGLTVRPWADMRIRPSAGYAFGRDGVSAVVTASLGESAMAPSMRLFWGEMGDIGGNPGATPLVNTISALSGEVDYLDPYLRRGVRLSVGSASVGGGASVGVRYERHESALDVVTDSSETDFRPVRSVHEGEYGAVDLAVGFAVPADGRARVSTTAGRLSDRAALSALGELEWEIGPGRASWSGRIHGEGGVTNPGAPVQTMFLLGGRHTLPGHDYRAYLGNGYWLLRAEGTVPVRPPYVGVRAFGVVGATYLGSVDIPPDWPLVDSDGLRGSVGVGLSIGWDTMFLDLAHGVRGGGWEAVVSVAQHFRGWM